MRKGRPYTMAASYVLPARQQSLRKALASMRRGHARTVHFAEDNDRVKHDVLHAMREHGILAVIIEAPRHRTREQPRELCLRAIARSALGNRARSLTFDRDESRVRRDNQVLYEELAKSDLRYEHRKSYEEPLLWAADALAWAWHRDKVWRAKVSDFVVARIVADD